MDDWATSKITPDGAQRKLTPKTRRKIAEEFWCTATSAKELAKELPVDDWRELLQSPEKTCVPYQEHSNLLRELAFTSIVLGEPIEPDENAFELINTISETHPKLRNYEHSSAVVSNVAEKLRCDGFLNKVHGKDNLYVLALPSDQEADLFAVSKLESEMIDVRAMLKRLASSVEFRESFIDRLDCLVTQCSVSSVLNSVYQFRDKDHLIHGHIAGFRSPRIAEKAIAVVKLHDTVLLGWRYALRLIHGGKTDGYRRAITEFNTLQLDDHRKLLDSLKERRPSVKKIRAILEIHTKRYLWLQHEVHVMKTALRVEHDYL